MADGFPVRDGERSVTNCGDRTAHERRIVDQFTKQAVPFSQMSGRSPAEALSLLLSETQVTRGDSVLDVACGPGLVVLAFAEVAKNVTGIDFVSAMIQRAKVLAAQRQVSNARFLVGDVNLLPFDSAPRESTSGHPGEKAGFAIVTCRYALHHLLNPAAAVAEMVRVCAPGGRVALVDVVTTSEQAHYYNEMEKLRDPSHVNALTLEELLGLAAGSGLVNLRLQFYRMELELECLLQGSFPAPGDAGKLRQMLIADIGHDRLGVGVHWSGQQVNLAYPIAMLVADKSSEFKA